LGPIIFGAVTGSSKQKSQSPRGKEGNRKEISCNLFNARQVIVPHYHDAKQSERKGAKRQKDKVHDRAYHVEIDNVSGMRPRSMLMGFFVSRPVRTWHSPIRRYLRPKGL